MVDSTDGGEEEGDLRIIPITFLPPTNDSVRISNVGTFLHTPKYPRRNDTGTKALHLAVKVKLYVVLDNHSHDHSYRHTVN
jgi:hypothetical protein